jgi:hypothetical protein
VSLPEGLEIGAEPEGDRYADADRAESA